MASLPSQPSRRRSSRDEAASSQEAQLPPQRSTSSSEQPQESFVLNNPQFSASPSSTVAETKPLLAEEAPKPEVRTCWICQMDSTEDTPETSIWRTPCPCSLTAHDECLMEWITSQEAPRPGEMATPHHIVCPQCQAEIKIQRPRDLIVLLIDAIQRYAKGLILPTAVSGLICCIYSGFLVYGINTLHLVFGSEDARRIMDPSLTDILRAQNIQGNPINNAFKRFIRTMDPFFPTSNGNWKLFLGLPAIAPGLILSRTQLADQVFAILPVIYFLFRPSNRITLTNWPPSPGLAFASLPYLRRTYNEIYRHTFSDFEKQWDAAVQRKPRDGETAEQIAQEAAEEEADGLLDLEVEFIEADGERDVVGDILNGNLAEIREAQGLQAAPIIWNAEQGVDALQQGNEPAAQGNDPQARQGRRGRNNNEWAVRQNISTAAVASTVMGALFFPAISSIMGDLLKVALPTKWVTRQGDKYGVKISEGMLKEKWGRSIIGGCLFVVLKDAVMLYCKWRKARDFGRKRVLDYVGKRIGETRGS